MARKVRARALVLAAALVVAASDAFGQVPAPRTYDATITTSPSQVLPVNNARYSLQFCNPSLTVYAAVCPTISGRTGSPLTCAFGGAGSVTIPPTFCRSIIAPDRSAKIPAAWNGVAQSGTIGLTIFETE